MNITNSIVTILSVFAPLFSKPVWELAQTLITGAMLCQGPHTVAAILRTMGLQYEKTFCKYHRVLNRDKWSGLKGANILLEMLVYLAVHLGIPIMIIVDETIERRKGAKIKAKGKYRDAVRSTEKNVVKCWGLKWICMMVLIPLPWSKRPWALPFLTILAPSKQSNDETGKKHKTTVGWTIQATNIISRWLSYGAWILIGDGAYACVELAHSCNANNVTLISRLRTDVRLFAFPEKQPTNKRSRKPKKGKRLPSIKELAKDPNQPWKEVDVTWYEGITKRVKILSGVCLWHTNGQDPVNIRWVLVVDPENEDNVEAFFSTDGAIDPKRIIEIFVLRWNIEVTFQEVRRHLGVETQHQWSDLAIARTTPALMALFSLVCLIALQTLKGGILPLRHNAWYNKKQATFSDVLAFVRRTLWAEKFLHNSALNADRVELSRKDMDALLDRLAAVP